MRLSQLRYFIEVCKCENITKAAQKIHVSQPSITVAIKDLEEELGIILFHRIKQRIFLTTEGDYFYKELIKILDDFDNLIETVSDLGNKKNHVKIGVPPMIGSFLFPEIFAGFQELHPEISLDIFEYGAMELRRMVLEEKLDLSIMIGEHSRQDGISFNPILKTKYSFYVGKNHPLVNKESVGFDNIKEEKIILFNEGFYIHKIVMDAFSAIGVEKPNIVLQTSQVQTVKKFIREGIAVGFLINNCVEDTDKLVEIPFNYDMPITIGLERKKGRHLYSDEASFIKYVDKIFKH